MKETSYHFTKEKRLIGMAIMGFLLGRVWLFDINPFAVAFFAAMCAQKRGKKWIALAIVAGMFTSADGLGLLKYIILFSIIFSVDYFQQKMYRGRHTMLFMSLLCGGLNLLLGTIYSVFSMNSWEMFWLSVLESIAVLALANVFQWGVHFFLFEEWNKPFGNEELVSVLALVFTALYGIPNVADDIFSVSSTVSYVLVLIMGYRYGAATGAITGAAGGVVVALSGGSMEVIGIYTLLGVCVGLLRQMEKMFSMLLSLCVGFGLIYMAKDQIIGIVELRALMSAIIVVLAIPKRILHMVEKDEEARLRNPFAKDDVRELANNQIEDFSKAFRRLSKSFDGKREQQKEVPVEEVERIYEELSEKICSGCANCNFCWDKHYEETKENIHRILWQAGEDVVLTQPKVSPEFSCRCIRLDAYVDYAKERMSVAKMTLGWRNRLAENREIMARQMMEVADALKSFTLDLGEIEEVSQETKRGMMEAIKKEGVRLDQFVVKRQKGKMEVVFSGQCHGNQCLTKTDISKALSRATGVIFRPCRETRNVLSGEKATMYFREDTSFKALTGLARLAKSGENVSGDNYSFLELQTGELLMVLADGMGSGEKADKNSSSFIEVLEHLLEAGFEKKSALRLLNTLFVANYEGTSFTTLDMVSVDLHTGECQIYKSGAAATFIRRKDGVETVISEALPVGIDMEAESEVTVTTLQEGDMVVMVSDGVMDAFYHGRMVPATEEDSLERLIENLPCQNPNDMANQILMNALARSDKDVTDDMSVLTAGIWNKN